MIDVRVTADATNEIHGKKLTFFYEGSEADGFFGLNNDSNHLGSIRTGMITCILSRS